MHWLSLWLRVVVTRWDLVVDLRGSGLAYFVAARRRAVRRRVPGRMFEQYAAVARAGAGARQASWFIPLTLQFAAHAMRDPLLRRRFAIVLAEAPDGGTSDGQLLKALGRVLPPAGPSPVQAP